VASRNFKTSDEEILSVLVEHPNPALTSSEIKEALAESVSRQGVNYRLNSLQDRGLVASKAFGASARGWWITDEGREMVWADGQSDADASSETQ
jgi:repressor of nif and glnA expression